MMRRLMTCGLTMLALIAAQSQARAGLVVYGLTTNGSIHAVDVGSHSDTTIYPASSSTNSPLTNTNGLAIDIADHLLIFSANNILQYYNLSNGNEGTVAVTSGNSVTGTISDAAYYNGSYYFVKEHSDILEQVALSVSPSGVPTISSVTSITLTGNAPTSLGFGDIAITSNGTLYGSSNAGIFSLNLAATTGGANGSFHVINANSTLYQIALDPSQTFLYAENATNGTWGTIALSSPTPGTNGTFVATPGFITTGFGDLADQTLITPEPTTFVMLGLAGLMGVAQSKLRKRRKALAA